MLDKQLKLFILVFVVSTACPAAFAQNDDDQGDSTQSPLALEEEEAKQRAEIAKAELEEAKARKELSELDLASNFVPAEAGITTKETASYYGELISFVTLEKAAELFVDSLNPYISDPNNSKPITKIIVSSDISIVDVAALWHLANSKFNLFKNAFPIPFKYQFVAPEGKKWCGGKPAGEAESRADANALAGVGLVTATLTAASQLAAFFKLKQELSGHTVNASSEALKAYVAKKLKSKEGYDLTPIFPELVIKVSTDLSDSIDHLRDLENEAAERKNEKIREVKSNCGVEIAKINERIKEAEEKLKSSKTSGDKAYWKDQKEKLDKINSWWLENQKELDQVTDEFHKFMARLESVPEGADLSGLEKLFLYDSIVDNETWLLIVKALSQGASLQTTSGALRRSKMSFVGGSASMFLLADLNGNVIATDVIPTVASETFTTSFTKSIGIGTARQVPKEAPEHSAVGQNCSYESGETDPSKCDSSSQH